MSIFADYYLERENRHTLEDEFGFASFAFIETYCYIVDIYVRPEFRRKHIASKYADEIAELAREKGYKFLMGSVDITTNGCSDSMKALLAYGFSLSHIGGNLIFLVKEI